MLLCEVSTGKSLKCSGNFVQTVQKARLEATREKLGLPKNAKAEDHPELQNAIVSQDMIHNLSGTNYDSLHFQTQGGPQPEGNVVHPDGYTIPLGHNAWNDEVIVYDQERVKMRYLIEMRDISQEVFKAVTEKEPDEKDRMDVDNNDDDDDQDDNHDDDEDDEDQDESDNSD